MSQATQPKSRSDMEFEVVYSMHLERMNAALLRRFSMLTWIVLIAFTIDGVNASANEFFSCLVAYAMAIFLLVVRPGEAAADSEASSERWADLSARMAWMCDRDLERAIFVAEKQDSRVLPALMLAAHRAAAVALDRDLSSVPTPNVVQRFAAAMAGSPAV